MPPKTPRKVAPKPILQSAAEKDAPVANGSPVNSPKEVSPIPIKKRALSEVVETTEKQDEPVGKKTKNSSTTPTKDSPISPRFPSPADQPASKHDQETWQGFCEIESNPEYFSVMLREMGVQGVTVRDLYSLDSATINTLPQPIYGLVLLFRAREVASEKQEEECPANVWFSNQLPGHNSCATLAMLNTLLNHDGIVDIGENLRQFKEFTSTMTPYQRGETLASFDFVKNIHNSFAKKLDIYEDDKHLAYKVARSEQRKKLGIKSKRCGSEESIDSNASFEDSAHHFIAFVPIDGEVWKLDGMDGQPTCMGDYDAEDTDDWLTVASEHINLIMAAGDNDYNVIAIAQAPLARLRSEMSETVATFKYAKKRIATLNTDWASFLPAPEPGIDPAEPITPTMLESIGVFEDMLAKATVSPDVTKMIDCEEFPNLLERCSKLCGEQMRLRELIFTEMGNEEEENQKASERRLDMGPVIKKWLEMLAENGWLEANMERFMPDDPKKKVAAKKGGNILDAHEDNTHDTRTIGRFQASCLA
ncbi:cysteine proteinase [Pleomassaria siparia CBS 279.74]|uniref:Ubiquitin carboxyl-terminal hydrolase n=1 Tax=Pleomassaria siparia CBS 279.74 TaxID=1314801 RepID=A0A6G1KMQ0_9PLEO|nr:cysteine proteinase [Pleomassaria siparia CBS 279.74]